MATVMIVGATRGIGLELVRQYAEAGDQVIACARDLSATDQLQDLVAGSDAIRVEQMDVGDFASIDAAAERIGDTPLDALILCAGVNGGAKQSLDDVDIDEWHRVLDINTIGPTLIARAFKSNLAASGNAHLMLLSSQLAASTWPMGGFLIYATTKAALSKVGQILALDWKDEPITVTVMHPGWVQTDMGGPHAEITAEESASGIREVVANSTKEDSGKFYKWNGDIHPW